MAQTVDDVVIVSQGEVRAQGPLSSLTSQASSSMRIRSPEPDRLDAVVKSAGFTPRRVATDVVMVDGATPEQLGPVLATNQVVIYELAQESQDLESLFLGLTTSLGGTPQVPGSATDGRPAQPPPPPPGSPA